MAQLKVMFARFPYLNAECPDSVDWWGRTTLKAKQDPRIGEVLQFRVDDTPITLGRNRAVQRALEHGVDYLLMLDSDMSPDLPGEQPFWDTSLDFALHHKGPCVIGAPYCGPPPCCNVYVFRWANWCNDQPNQDWRLEQFSREEAAMRLGIEPVAALPTGLILIDVRALQSVAPPWFYYEWKDAAESEKASTEDVTFTRDLSLLGVPMYCNWSSWAGHWKRYLVEKPRPVTVEQIGAKYRAAVLADRGRADRAVDVGEGGLPMTPDGKADLGKADLGKADFAKANALPAGYRLAVAPGRANGLAHRR
jgi:hypothetical protein